MSDLLPPDYTLKFPWLMTAWTAAPFDPHASLKEQMQRRQEVKYLMAGHAHWQGLKVSVHRSLVNMDSPHCDSSFCLAFKLALDSVRGSQFLFATYTVTAV
eukprot:SAG31_NODE_19091_length_612_cov_1.120858_1_plen_100_part_10